MDAAFQAHLDQIRYHEEMVRQYFRNEKRSLEMQQQMSFNRLPRDLREQLSAGGDERNG